MANIVKISLATLGLVLCAAVLLHSLHASHILGLVSSESKFETKKAFHDDTAGSRPELHHHSDKQAVSSLIKTFGADQNTYSADARSLRLLHERRRDWLHVPRNLGWLREWWQLHHLSLTS